MSSPNNHWINKSGALSDLVLICSEGIIKEPLTGNNLWLSDHELIYCKWNGTRNKKVGNKLLIPKLADFEILREQVSEIFRMKGLWDLRYLEFLKSKLKSNTLNLHCKQGGTPCKVGPQTFPNQMSSNIISKSMLGANRELTKTLF